MEENGRWITINGAHIFLKDGQSPMDAFIRQNVQDNSTDDATSYDTQKNGKLTRNKMIKYLDDVKEKIKNDLDTNEQFQDYTQAEKNNILSTIPNYNNALLNMRYLGFGMVDIEKMEFKNERRNYGVLATLKNGSSVYLIEIDK